MPVYYQIKEHNLVHTRCVGKVTFQEVMSHFMELNFLSSDLNELNVLLDLTASETLPMLDQVREISGEIGELRAKFNWRAMAVVANEDAAFDISRMFEIFIEPFVEKSRVFRRVEEAQYWLLLNQDLAPPKELAIP